MRQAAVHATALNYTPKVLAAIEERMRTDDETTGTTLVKMVNAAGDKTSRVQLI